MPDLAKSEKYILTLQPDGLWTVETIISRDDIIVEQKKHEGVRNIRILSEPPRVLIDNMW